VQEAGDADKGAEVGDVRVGAVKLSEAYEASERAEVRDLRIGAVEVLEADETCKSAQVDDPRAGAREVFKTGQAGDGAEVGDVRVSAIKMVEAYEASEGAEVSDPVAFRKCARLGRTFRRAAPEDQFPQMTQPRHLRWQRRQTQMRQVKLPGPSHRLLGDELLRDPQAFRVRHDATLARRLLLPSRRVPPVSRWTPARAIAIAPPPQGGPGSPGRLALHEC
jgi:hypothetical protein